MLTNLEMFPYQSMKNKNFWKKISSGYLMQCVPEKNESMGKISFVVEPYLGCGKMTATMELKGISIEIVKFEGDLLSLWSRMRDIVTGAIIMFDTPYRLLHEPELPVEEPTPSEVVAERVIEELKTQGKSSLKRGDTIMTGEAVLKEFSSDYIDSYLMDYVNDTREIKVDSLYLENRTIVPVLYWLTMKDIDTEKFKSDLAKFLAINWLA